jgi:O-antigen/teichoic acid export membrane protein
MIYAGCQWGVLVTTVRLTSPADVGALSLGFAISAPIFLCLHLRLRSASATDVKDAFSPSDYINLRVVCTLLALLITYAICKLSSLSADTLSIVIWIALAKAMESGSDLLYGFSQKANDMRIVSISMIGRGILSVLAFGWILFESHSVVFALAGFSAAWAAILICVDIPCTFRRPSMSGIRIFQFKWRQRETLSLVVSTLPLGISTMLTSLSSNMPRYFIEKYLGSAELGLFAAMSYLAMVTSVIVTALAESGIARMATHINDRDTTAASALIHKIVVLTMLLSVAGVVGCMAVGERGIRILYSGNYVSAYGMLVWMMVVSGISNLASVYGFALVAGRRYSSYLQCLIIASTSMAAACLLLVPRWGAKGAVLSCLVGYSIQLAWSYQKTRDMLASHGAQFPSLTVLNES